MEIEGIKIYPFPQAADRVDIEGNLDGKWCFQKMKETTTKPPKRRLSCCKHHGLSMTR